MKRAAQRSLFCALVWLGFAGLGSSADHDPPVALDGRRLDYFLIVTGEELLRGAYADAHTAFIARTLLPLGGHCVGSLIVDDRPEDVQEALRFATNKARLILVTGGLGPTVNDITRPALSAFTGIAVREHPEVLAELERRFRTPRDQLRDNLRRQTQVPVQGRHLKNPNGTAVGLVFERDDLVIVALPGPPRELQPMVTNELVPYLRAKFGVRPPGGSLTLRFVGVGQSQIDQTLRERVVLPPGTTVGSTFEAGRVDFTFFLPGNSAADEARLRKLAADVRAHLGEFIYAEGDVTLEETVAAELRVRGGGLVLVDIGTGGRLAASLHGVRNAESLLTGAFVAPTEERMRQLVNVPPEQWTAWKSGEDRVAGLGRAARHLARGQWVIVVGPVNSSTRARELALGIGTPEDQWSVHRVPAQGTGESAQAHLITQILDRLRRQLRR